MKYPYMGEINRDLPIEIARFSQWRGAGGKDDAKGGAARRYPQILWKTLLRTIDIRR